MHACRRHTTFSISLDGLKAVHLHVNRLEGLSFWEVLLVSDRALSRIPASRAVGRWLRQRILLHLAASPSAGGDWSLRGGAARNRTVHVFRRRSVHTTEDRSSGLPAGAPSIPIVAVERLTVCPRGRMGDAPPHPTHGTSFGSRKLSAGGRPRAPQRLRTCSASSSPPGSGDRGRQPVLPGWRNRAVPSLSGEDREEPLFAGCPPPETLIWGAGPPVRSPTP
jgi:hypothetical protein